MLFRKILKLYGAKDAISVCMGMWQSLIPPFWLSLVTDPLFFHPNNPMIQHPQAINYDRAQARFLLHTWKGWYYVTFVSTDLVDVLLLVAHCESQILIFFAKNLQKCDTMSQYVRWGKIVYFCNPSNSFARAGLVWTHHVAQYWGISEGIPQFSKPRV